MTTSAPPYTESGESLVAVRRFAELSVADVSYAGGKGANLGQLTQLGANGR